MLGLAEWVEALICGVSLGSSLCTTQWACAFRKDPPARAKGANTGHQKKGEWQIRSDEDVEHHLNFFFPRFCSPLRFSYYNTQAHEMRRGSRRWKVPSHCGLLSCTSGRWDIAFLWGE